MTEVPFCLSDGEQVIRDADGIIWSGAGAGRMHIWDAGTGSLVSVTAILTTAGTMLVRKVSKKVDRKTVHVYLTSERLVFMNSSATAVVNLHMPGETPSETSMLYEIPLEITKVILPVTRLGAPSIEIQKGSSQGHIDTLALGFSTGGDTANRKDRDEWLGLVEDCRSQLVRRKGSREGHVVSPEDPMLILKLRYAKGEISKEQYSEMQAELLK